MIITIQEQEFDTTKIKQLYPAAIVKTGYKDETTQVSLEWLDVEAKDKVELVGYGIFVHLREDEKYTFMFNTKEELDKEIGCIASQIK
jgi:hypothetical protein